MNRLLPAPPRSLAVRLAVSAGLWVAVAILMSALLLSYLFERSVERKFDEQQRILLDALIAVAEEGPDGQIRLRRGLGDPRFDQPYSGWYWQIATPDGTIVTSRSLWDQTLPLRERAEGAEDDEGPLHPYRVAGPAKQALRVLERDIRMPGIDGMFQFAVAGDIAQMRIEAKRFNAALLTTLGLLGMSLMTAILVQVSFGLRPLRRLRRLLADIRAGRAQRLGGVWPAEIAPLADELNALLDHDAALVERARTHLGNLAHGLKTPLSVLLNEAEKADGPLAETVRREGAVMRRLVEHHLARARAAATAGLIGARCDVDDVAAGLLRTIGRLHGPRGVAFERVGETGLSFRGERQDLEEMLGNLLDNAGKWARGKVRLTVGSEGGTLALAVEDDGPGLATDDPSSAFVRGLRLDESVPGSGLGLAIVRDLAELYDGAIDLSASPMGGLRAVLRLPRAA